MRCPSSQSAGEGWSCEVESRLCRRSCFSTRPPAAVTLCFFAPFALQYSENMMAARALVILALAAALAR